MPNPPRSTDFEGVTAARRDPLGFHDEGSAIRLCPTLRWTDAAGTHGVALAGRAVAGSAAEVDMVVADPTVSRLHAELEPRADGVWVRDLGSRNGTFIDNVLVQSARVPEGGRLLLGSTVVTVDYTPAPTPIERWPEEHFGPLVGRSAAMRELFALLARVAPTDSTVLLQGETGTGKELVAQAIHAASPRRDQVFAIVDCAALPENLLEAELFGHAKGAFTGATSARAGAIESAEGGTVFLDEIGELPLAMQPKLLRALESRMVRRLGESQHRRVDVRFVSATHRDLREMVNSGAFREDLYFRLAVLPVTIPPLRARLEDIALLVEHFLPPGSRGALGPELLREMESRPWLGNVRELRNFVERAQALGARHALQSMRGGGAGGVQSTASAGNDGGATRAGEWLPKPPFDQPFKDVRERWLDHLEREYVKGLLGVHGRNVSAVAQAAGLDRTYIHRLIRKHDL